MIIISASTTKILLVVQDSSGKRARQVWAALLQENRKPGAERHSVTEATGIRVTYWCMVQEPTDGNPVQRTEKI
ncbi:hypothetical protein RGCCGE502_18595 [Rhizobium grahamii CCGE 502]|uniref:Uncharacterized protein n=1 Tax=Rhizobium grahamii CCGE 502 TaxID=990285 RepID=S3HU36_9HYPH|nr:hypothetical protein RGCCGE502_18595 [Rhizobium grahamii CCGE 502]